MDVTNRTLQPLPSTSAAMDHSEEVLAEVDEPPEHFQWSPTKLHFGHLKSTISQRRESLLTRQILSENEHTDEDDVPPPPRTMSTQSTWSNPSTTSMAELTSDDGRSVASPAISPPLLPTHRTNHIVPAKPLDAAVKIVGEDHVVGNADNQVPSEKAVEANLGRKRCISFACRGKQETKVEPPPPAKEAPASPPKRKCMLKFVCPSKSGSESKPATKPAVKRPVSPPPPQRRPTGKHRGSDSTVTQMSPKATRKNSAHGTSTPRSTPAEPALPEQPKKYFSGSSDEEGGDSMRFHEFASSDDEPEQWVQESTCHRTRLTVNDTLKKENVIRKTCEEVEEEALEEEDDMEDEDLEDEMAAVAEMDDEDDDVEGAEDYESDEGFHSDDEEGFANSDSDDDSDYEWWKPGGVSTAATSVEQLDRLAIVNSNKGVPSSSLGSASSGGHMSGLASRTSLKKTKSRQDRTEALAINPPGSPGLPDSTDFVCGTLDEDRPLEQAYINRRNLKLAAKNKVRPQDIDPTFPTSDPEMDEEDDDDVDEVLQSETDDNMMHGDLEELHGTVKKLSPFRPRDRSSTHKSPPPPPTRIHSPGPAKRTGPRSPPPPTMRARSPAPRKLFINPPTRSKSPAPLLRMTSPPNSPTNATSHLATLPFGLAGRPALTHTASLPRGGPITLSKLATISDNEDTDTGAATEIPKRGAVDIVKGVQWKRQRRKEKLYQKACAKAAAKGDKQHKVKPGKGAERMREVGLQLQQYRGKAEHILSL